jgi:hypothetical protein
MTGILIFRSKDVGPQAMDSGLQVKLFDQQDKILTCKPTA